MNPDSRDFLFEGAIRAVVHSAHLAKDALMLFQGGRHSSAYVLSVMAREELGRANYLSKEAADLAPGGTLTMDLIKKLRKKLGDHKFKLERGQSITQMQLPPALKEKMERAHASADEATLLECFAQIRALDDEARKAAPSDIHGRRMFAQYVDLQPTGST
ncbi:MAG: AbiV family abortive infection protein [Hyphomonadaceae bacterium]|nr:AbiV family abortive infection protein [Hyphomonadaceae bacterium]